MMSATSEVVCPPVEVRQDLLDVGVIPGAQLHLLQGAQAPTRHRCAVQTLRIEKGAGPGVRLSYWAALASETMYTSNVAGGSRSIAVILASHLASVGDT